MTAGDQTSVARNRPDRRPERILDRTSRGAGSKSAAAAGRPGEPVARPARPRAVRGLTPGPARDGPRRRSATRPLLVVLPLLIVTGQICG